MLLPYVWKLWIAFPERHSFLRYALASSIRHQVMWSWSFLGGISFHF